MNNTLTIAHRKQVWFKDRAVFDSVIDACSGFGGYCHTELLFPNGESFTSTTKFDRATLVYPHRAFADPRKNGPLIRRIEFPDWEWDFTRLPVTDSQLLQVYEWCQQTINESISDRAGYDWNGVLRFVFKFMKEHPKDWFCTESVVAACQQIGLFTGVKPWTRSPNRFRKMCRKFETITGSQPG